MPDLFERDVCNCGHPDIEGTPCHKVCRHCRQPIRSARLGVYDARCTEIQRADRAADALFKRALANRMLAALAHSSPF